MSYIEDSLTPGEKVVYRAHLHWIIYTRTLLLLLVAGLIFWAASGTSGNTATVLNWLALVTLGVAALFFLVALILVATTNLAVTNYRVLAKHGLIERQTIEQNLKTLDGVEVHQSVLGRILGYGSVQTRGSGGGHTPIDNISRPLEFRRQVEIAANAYRTPSETR